MGNFKKEFLGGVAYTAIAKYTGIFIQIGISAVMARLLDPTDFGIIAIASIFIGIVNLLTDFGLGPAIIQSDKLDESDLQSLFSFTTIVGIIGATVVFLCSNLAANYYGNEGLVNIFRLLSLNVVFAAVNIVPNALLLKVKQFKLIAIRTLMMQIASGIIGVVLAYIGFGLYALAVQSLLSALGIFVFNYIQNPIRPFARITKRSLDKVIHFSIFQFLAQIFNYFTKDLDKLLLGKYTNLTELGYYEKSYRLMQLPVGNLAYVFTPVMQPVFREYQYDLKMMFEKYGIVLKALSIIAFPLSAFLWFEGGDLIRFVYGDKWDMAVPAFQYLSVGICFNILLSSSGPMFLASNNVKMSFYNCIMEFVISISCLSIGLWMGGINNVAIMVSIGLMLRFIYIFSMLTLKAFKQPLYLFLKHICLGVIIGVISILLFYIIDSRFKMDFSFIRLCVNTIIFFLLVGFAMLKGGILKQLKK